ncbi:hypothetical protein HMPREF3192_01294 [Atopobium deltae]|uniref:Uncharacterized protein n=1 Tax=Atopobium deltae TaxID=1393034 RepID=A0A133XPR4_9ACTN|nr:hypothetical protein HMPREF3192_01294 [Atopobium deltae]
MTANSSAANSTDAIPNLQERLVLSTFFYDQRLRSHSNLLTVALPSKVLRREL